MEEYFKKSGDTSYYKWKDKEYIECSKKLTKNNNILEKESINTESTIEKKHPYDDTKVKSNKKNSIAEFINNNFKGINITIYTKSSQKINGEVIFNHNNIIVLKSENQIYYINPKEVIYFF